MSLPKHNFRRPAAWKDFSRLGNDDDSINQKPGRARCTNDGDQCTTMNGAGNCRSTPNGQLACVPIADCVGKAEGDSCKLPPIGGNRGNRVDGAGRDSSTPPPPPAVEGVCKQNPNTQMWFCIPEAMVRSGVPHRGSNTMGASSNGQVPFSANSNNGRFGGNGIGTDNGRGNFGPNPRGSFGGNIASKGRRFPTDGAGNFGGSVNANAGGTNLVSGSNGGPMGRGNRNGNGNLGRPKSEDQANWSDFNPPPGFLQNVHLRGGQR